MTDPLWDWVDECLSPLGVVRVRKMFGGAGVSLDGLSIGLIVDGLLYLKVDAETASAFIAEGLEPFRYEKGNGTVAVMSYRRAPDAAFDDPEIMRHWAQLATAAAARAQAKPGRKAKKGERS